MGTHRCGSGGWRQGPPLVPLGTASESPRCRACALGLLLQGRSLLPSAVSTSSWVPEAPGPACPPALTPPDIIPGPRGPYLPWGAPPARPPTECQAWASGPPAPPRDGVWSVREGLIGDHPVCSSRLGRHRPPIPSALIDAPHPVLQKPGCLHLRHPGLGLASSLSSQGCEVTPPTPTPQDSRPAAGAERRL